VSKIEAKFRTFCLPIKISGGCRGGQGVSVKKWSFIYDQISGLHLMCGHWEPKPGKKERSLTAFYKTIELTYVGRPNHVTVICRFTATMSMSSVDSSWHDVKEIGLHLLYNTSLRQQFQTVKWNLFWSNFYVATLVMDTATVLCWVLIKFKIYTMSINKCLFK